MSLSFKPGIPSSAANGLLNSHWYVKVRQVDDHFVCTWRCEEMPEMDSVMSFQEGVVSKVDCPLFGGKAKVTDDQNN